MDKVLAKIRTNLNRLNCKKASILLSVSGGIDSMTMLDALYKLKDEYSLKLSIAYINHNLRQKESSEEETFITEEANKYSLPFYKHTIKKEFWDNLKKESIEMAARRIRYDFLKKTTKINNLGYIATAHNLNDKIETFFLQLFRAGGTETLRSIPFRNNKIIRPLINISKKEINEYALINSIKYFEDSSNKKNVYKRNIIRNKLLPIFRDIHPNYQFSFKHLFSFINEDQKYLNKAALKKYKKMLILSSDKYVCLKKDLFGKSDIVIKKRIIKYILRIIKYPASPNLSIMNYLIEYKDKYKIKKEDLLCISSGKYLWFINKKRISKIKESFVQKMPYIDKKNHIKLDVCKNKKIDPKNEFVFALKDKSLPLIVRSIKKNDKIDLPGKKDQDLQNILKRSNIPSDLFPEVVLIESKGKTIGFFLKKIFAVSSEFFIKKDSKTYYSLQSIKKTRPVDGS